MAVYPVIAICYFEGYGVFFAISVVALAMHMGSSMNKNLLLCGARYESISKRVFFDVEPSFWLSRIIILELCNKIKKNHFIDNDDTNYILITFIYYNQTLSNKGTEIC